MSQLRLLGQRRFAPYFATQALGAFNDNAFRNALIVMVGFHMALDTGKVTLYANLAPALFILPFFLFSASAGQLAEKYDKARLIRWIKLFEIAAMSVAAFGLHTHGIALLLTVLFLMGVHSTVFGPIKYAILPQTLRHEELMGGNGLVETGTSLAILLGMTVGGALMASGAYAASLTSALLLAVAVAGYLCARAIPATPASSADLRFDFNPLRASREALRLCFASRASGVAVTGISWFWFFGGIVTAQLPNYTRLTLHGDGSVLVLALTLFSIGVGIGSMACETLSRRRVSPWLTLVGAGGLGLVGIDLYLASTAAPGETTAMGWRAFIAAAGHWRIELDLALTGIFAGLYIVPLFAWLQSLTPTQRLSRVIAGTNIVNAAFIVAAALAGIGALHAGVSIASLYLAAGLATPLVALGLLAACPQMRSTREPAAANGDPEQV